VDANGRPRYWAAYWLLRSAAGWAASTQAVYVAAVERLYRSVEASTGSDRLDELIGSLDIATLDQCLDTFFAGLRNEQTRSGASRERTWAAATEFVRASLDDLVHRSVPSSRRLAQLRGLDRLAAMSDRLKTGRRARRRQKVRSLPAGVVEDLYELTWPGSARNPFRTDRARHRNFALFLLLLHQGLRRGELLILPVNAVRDDRDHRTGALRYWIDVTTNPYEHADPRACAPSIKTEYSERPMPVAEPVVVSLETYVNNFRGRQGHSFLFASQERRPLSVNAVNDVFRTLSDHLSPAAGRELWRLRRERWISPHDLRHTCAVVRLRQLVSSGVALEDAIEMLRGFFGWAPESDMPRLYARAYFDERFASVWNPRFDARVELLRGLK
jgi:integrase